MNVDSCNRILAAGGNLIVGTMNADSLVRLAETAAQHKVHLTVRGTMNVDSIIRIIRAGKGHVTFDVSGA
jgi:hypothetical protein